MLGTVFINGDAFDVQVLELGILVHSVIVGISLGASQRPSTIRPLVGALSFHQFFEGIGLGGCIVQVHPSSICSTNEHGPTPPPPSYSCGVAGRLQSQVNGGHGGLLLPHGARRHRVGHRDILRVRRRQLDGPHRRGGLQCRLCWHPRLHGSRGSTGGRLHQPQDAEQWAAATWSTPRPSSRRRFDVPDRHMGIEQDLSLVCYDDKVLMAAALRDWSREQSK